MLINLYIKKGNTHKLYDTNMRIVQYIHTHIYGFKMGFFC